ncbi:hypothetical protein [Rhizobium phage RHph_X3_9]|nr:hypothetical protein [Rhizobium phage RHph_X3_9]
MLAVLTALRSTAAKWALIAAFVVGVIAAAYRAGRQSTKADIDRAILRTVEEKAEIDAEVSGMSADARRDELRKWSRQ